jgi:hypothetical protein
MATLNSSPKVVGSMPPITLVGLAAVRQRQLPGHDADRGDHLHAVEPQPVSAPSSGLTPAKLNWLIGNTMKSPWKLFPMAPLTDAFADSANTVMNEMRATPMMMAAAVDAVRRGLRTAFCREILPVMPPSRGRGLPTTRATGPA